MWYIPILKWCDVFVLRQTFLIAAAAAQQYNQRWEKEIKHTTRRREEKKLYSYISASNSVDSFFIHHYFGFCCLRISGFLIFYRFISLLLFLWCRAIAAAECRVIMKWLLYSGDCSTESFIKFWFYLHQFWFVTDVHCSYHFFASFFERQFKTLTTP